MFNNNLYLLFSFRMFYTQLHRHKNTNPLLYVSKRLRNIILIVNAIKQHIAPTLRKSLPRTKKCEIFFFQPATLSILTQESLFKLTHLLSPVRYFSRGTVPGSVYVHMWYNVGARSTQSN